MKKAFFLLLCTTLLQAAEIALPGVDSEPELIKPNIHANEKLSHGYAFRPLSNNGSFNYLSIGASTISNSPQVLQSTLPSLTFGRRWLHDSIGLDSSVGLRFGEYAQSLYLQSSYLLYPFQPNRLYMGVGLEGGIRRKSLENVPSRVKFRYDMPVTLGYQFAGSEHRNFLQFQAYPKAYASDDNLTFAVSYGFGF